VTRTLPFVRLALLVAVVVTMGGVAEAQSSSDDPGAPRDEDAAPAAGGGAASAQAPADEGALDLAEPEYYVVNLPTTLRLPRHKGDFRLTHRFGGNLREGGFLDQLSNLFGIDQGATVGLEYRYAVATSVQVAITRSSFDKTIQFSGKYDAVRQAPGMPVSLSGLVSIEGPNNFQERFAPALGAVVSREIGDWIAMYATPVWVHNSAAAIGVDRDTLLVGFGGRVRVRPTVYVVAEVSPRIAGYDPGQPEYGFGIEKRAGGHMFQLTFSNTFGTTFGQLARGGSPDTLYLGFNLSRKFF
jgi:hypothetical protein